MQSLTAENSTPDTNAILFLLVRKLFAEKKKIENNSIGKPSLFCRVLTLCCVLVVLTGCSPQTETPPGATAEPPRATAGGHQS